MINIENLTFSYSKKSKLFENLSLKLEAGSITGLFGKNGAGKTTLLKLLSGLLFHKNGKIIVNGFVPQKRIPDFLCNFYFIPEDIYYPAISFKNYVKASASFYSNFSNETLNRVLTEFELSENSNLDKISLGQQKKFMIAFALATRSRVLLLDEPTNGLDIPSKALFRKVIAGALDENQIVLISTHQVKDIENLIDNVLILNNGQFVFHKNTFDISTSFSFIEKPIKEIEGSLYSENSPTGYRHILKNTHNSMEIDFELLFNAIVNNVSL